MPHVETNVSSDQERSRSRPQIIIVSPVKYPTHTKQNSKYFSQFLYCLLPGLRLHTARTEISKDNLLSPHSGHTYSGYIWHDSKGSRYVTRYYSHSKSRSPAFQTCPQLLAIPAPLPPTVNIMGIGRWLYTITNTL